MTTLPTPYYDDGQVTIYHGDCREILPQIRADVLVTDPPYGIALQSGMNGKFGESHIAGDQTTGIRDVVLENWERPAIVFGSVRAPRPDQYRAVLIWDKGEHVGMGNLSFPWKPNFEEIYIIGDGFSGKRTSSVLRYHAVAGCVGLATVKDRHHPTQKPLGLMRDLIGKCPPGIIVDPFMGSGTTLIAARDLGRSAIGIELEEVYCRAAVSRLQQSVMQFVEPATRATLDSEVA